MKKKWTILFILAVACAFSISAIAATTFENQDFDGKFKMDVIQGADFEKTESDGVITYLDADKNLFLIYSEDSSINPKMDDAEYKTFELSSGFNPDGKDGDIRVYKKNDIYGAMAVGDGIMVVVGYDDRADAIDMAKSIVFTK